MTIIMITGRRGRFIPTANGWGRALCFFLKKPKGSENLIHELLLEDEGEAMERLRPATNTARPCGGDALIESVQAWPGRTAGARRRGRKPLPRGEEEKQSKHIPTLGIFSIGER